MVLSVLQNIVLIAFIVTSVIIIYKDRKLKMGIVVKDKDGFEYCDGSQGIYTTIGRDRHSDVYLKSKSISRLQALVRYDAENKKFNLSEMSSKKGSCKEGYKIDDTTLTFQILPQNNFYEYGYMPFIMSVVFILLQAIAMYKEFASPLVMLPYGILFAYMFFNFATRADKQPITEGIFSILLTFYIESGMYYYGKDEELTHGVIYTFLGVLFYTVTSLFMKYFLKMKPSKIYQHNDVRILCTVAILFLILINVIFASNINGAYNWVSFGPLSFQPGEIIKILMLFVMVTPANKVFYSFENLCFVIGTPAVCFVYAIAIRDIGLLLQLGAIFGISVLLQNEKILYSILMIVAAIAGCKGVTYVSATAKSRLEGWMGESEGLFECLTGNAAFESPHEYGYQSIMSMIAAFENGGLFGNREYDILAGVEAANSDLVMSFISQRHGYLTMFLLLALFGTLIFNTWFSLKQQDKYQQTFSSIAMTLVVIAVLLNTLGTFAVIPLTGVVNPAVSYGISASFCYGAAFGAFSSSAINKEYLNQIKKGVN